MRRVPGTVLFPCVILAAFLAGCASSSATSGSSAADAPYSNFLVVGVAGNYSSRAQFERSVVSGIKAEGASASAFHVAAGGNKPLTRDLILSLVARGAFDAVIVTQVLDREADATVKGAVTGTKVSRKDGGVLNLFRYDYEEIDEPLKLEMDMQITFSTELYSSASESLVWSSETKGRRVSHVGELIDQTAETVVRQLDRAGLIKH